ncbi:MAG: OmpA family protein [Pseudomonadota bacterium]|nr:OmpA family protein [Pseudomonadota bacterium]
MLLSLVVSTALAQAGPTGGVAGGLLVMEGTNPLGDAPGVVVRLGVSILPVFDIEASIGRMEGDTRDLHIVYWLLDPRLDTLYHFTPNKRVDVFFSIGAGLEYVNVIRDSKADNPDFNDRALYKNPSSDFVMNGGPGLLLHLAGPIHLRTDLRWFGSFGSDSTAARADTYQNLEWTLGFDLRYEEPPDKDKDGIKNKYDDCPEDPEDFDEFEDDDGCPEEDNDKDGVRDARDDCPNDPEDRDDFEDGDGCPEPDNDGDGIRDKKDRCPDVAEDEDGFEDGDGCPERDNDEDGIPDKRDKCPEDPETRNNFEDKDGCPDEIPVEVTRFTGVIRGITFETNKAVIRTTSQGTLLDALDVLEEFPDVRLEVQGHTDDVGNDQLNLELSQARADAVIQWFFDYGVAPDRLRAVGYGETVPLSDNGTDAGRAENRRVEFRLLEDAPEAEE